MLELLSAFEAKLNKFATRSLSRAALFLLVAACGEPRQSAPEPQSAAAQSLAPQRFVAFRQPNVVLTSLEVATAPPVAVGSTLAGDLLSSSDPEIVSVDASGNLVAHKNGTVVIRSNAGATLQVIVNAVAKLRIVPDRLELVSGKTASVKLTGDGRDLPESSYRWETTNPNTAVAFGSTIHAGFTPGTATLTLRSGAATGTLKVVVREPSFQLRIRGPQGTVKLGSVERLVAEVPAGLPVEWTSANAAVLQPLRDGAFYARAKGATQICASAGSRRACKRLSVR